MLTMKTIAAAETTRKKGRRSESGRPRRKLQAPPGFWAKMKSKWSLITEILRGACVLGSAPESFALAQPLVARSAASEPSVTATRNEVDAFSRGGGASAGTGRGRAPRT